MKFNKWTLGLAALGAVSLASAARADETALSPVQTALSGTTISGVVDVGYQQQLGDVRHGNNHGSRAGSQSNLPSYGTGQYVDGFSLNQVIISLDKALEADKPWSAGYHIDLNFGDAAIQGYAVSHLNNINNLNDGIAAVGGVAIRQAYITLNTPLGNGIDWKVGVMDGVTGYESNTLSSNPNFTRSYGWGVNPATYTGILGSYKINELISVQGGLINRNIGNGNNDNKLQSHSYVATATLTAPESFGFIKGSTINLGTVQGFDNQSVNNYSVDATLATPLAGLRFGAAYDAVQSLMAHNDGNIYGVYATYQATDKLGFAVRGEYVNAPDLGLGVWKNGEELTATVSYNLWANVVSRLECRWDHSENSPTFYSNRGTPDYQNAFLVAANVAYKF